MWKGLHISHIQFSACINSGFGRPARVNWDIFIYEEHKKLAHARLTNSENHPESELEVIFVSILYRNFSKAHHNTSLYF